SKEAATMTGQSKDLNESENLMTFRGSRRDFFKVMTAVTAGAIALNFPGVSKAATAIGGRNVRDSDMWNDVQEEFMLGDLVYLNTGTEGSMPQVVFNNLCSYLKRFTSNPWNAINNDQDLNIFQALNRQKAADFLGAPSGTNIVLTNNTTWGLNVVLHGLDFRAGDTIITTVHENGAALSPLHLLRDRRGVIVRQIALPTPAKSAQDIVDAFEA